MERLILEFTATDGYNYSHDLSLPLIYKDKESAIEDLYKQLCEYQQSQIEISTEIGELNSQRKKVHNRIKNNRIKNNNNIDAKLSNEFLDISNKISLKQSELNKPIEFGGQSFTLDMFTETPFSQKGNIEIPRIFTIDEFFHRVENKISPSSKLKF